MFKKFLSLIMSFLMLFSFSLNVYAQTNDYSSHWANNTIEKWKNKGIVNGYEDGSFKPENGITRAEFAQILVRIFGYTNVSNSKVYSDITSNDWFYNAVKLISSAKLMHGFNDEKFRANEKITREEAIYAIAKAYKVTGKTAKSFNDEDKISDWAKDFVNAMYANGYINGTPQGNVNPKSSLTRAELLTIIDKTTASLINAKGTYQEDVDGNLIVNVRDVELKNMTISGNLYLAEGIGDGDVTLDNITVKGNVIVEGGGENSIKSKNSSYYSKFIVNASNPVRIVVEGNSVKVEIDPGVNITLSGNFSEVSVAPNTNVKLSDANVEKINVIPQNPSITEALSAPTIVLDEKSKVDTIIADSAVNVEGKGTISNIEVNSDGVKTEQKVENVKVADGVKTEIGGKVIDKPATGGNTSSGPSDPYEPNNPVLKDKYYVTGTVVDEDGAVVAYADVELYDDNDIYRWLATDENGKFSFYTESNREYYIYASVVDENDYGYDSYIELSKLTSDKTNIVLKLEITPVLVYSAVDKNGVPMGRIGIRRTYNNGVTGQYAYIRDIDQGDFSQNVVFRSKEYDETFYVMYDYSSGEKEDIILSNVEKEIKKSDNGYKTEIKLILKDYGLDSTTLTGKILPVDGIAVKGRRVYLNKYDFNGNRIGNSENVLTDENGIYTFENLEAEKYIYKIYVNEIFNNGAWYTRTPFNDLRLNKDIKFVKSYAFNIKAVDKNGVNLKDVEGTIFKGDNALTGFWLDDGGASTEVRAFFEPGEHVIAAEINVNGKRHLAMSTVTVVEGQYKPYECVLRFDTYEVPESKVRTVIGNVSYTSDSATTPSAIEANMIDKVTVYFSSESEVLLKTIGLNQDGSFKIEKIIDGEYYLEVEMIYEDKVYYFNDWVLIDENNLQLDIVLKLIN